MNRFLIAVLFAAALVAPPVLAANRMTPAEALAKSKELEKKILAAEEDLRQAEARRHRFPDLHVERTKRLNELQAKIDEHKKKKPEPDIDVKFGFDQRSPENKVKLKEWETELARLEVPREKHLALMHAEENDFYELKLHGVDDRRRIVKKLRDENFRLFDDYGNMINSAKLDALDGRRDSARGLETARANPTTRPSAAPSAAPSARPSPNTATATPSAAPGRRPGGRRAMTGDLAAVMRGDACPVGYKDCKRSTPHQHGPGGKVVELPKEDFSEGSAHVCGGVPRVDCPMCASYMATQGQLPPPAEAPVPRASVAASKEDFSEGSAHVCGGVPRVDCPMCASYMATHGELPPPAEAPAASPSPGASPSPQPSPATTASAGKLVIKPGDTLSAIATKLAPTIGNPPLFGPTGLVAVLYRNIEGNRGSNPNLIFPGQVIDLAAVKKDLAA